MRSATGVAALAACLSGAFAQNCISLAGSNVCRAFNASSISTNSQLVGFFPFLAFVSNVQEFDQQLNQYISQAYVQEKYVNLFSCDNVNLANTTNYYARYEASFICNSIIQNSRTPCGLTDTTARPLCADSCASFALSEEEIVSSNQFCPGRGTSYADQLRADFTNCALPANSLSGTCITGASNEPNNCGFANNLVGLCNYCRESTVNSTDSCCFTSNSTNRCQGVQLPVFSSIAGLFSTPTGSGTGPTATGSGAAADGDGRRGLSGGAIAGIVVGSIVGFLLLLGLIIFACITFRKRRGSHNGSILNQPSPQRKVDGMSTMSYNPPASRQGYEVLPGGRVARMTAMQTDDTGDGTRQFVPGETYPGSGQKVLPGAIPMKNSPGSSNGSPNSNDFSSPEGVASGQSEQLPFFKDYYSNADIHPNDKVSVLWAYSPRAGDEFELERGDMIRVVGIWDDGWATGVRISDRAEDYDGKHKEQRDSGVSNGSVKNESPLPAGSEIKAFPLVCVCLPEAWKKTVEGDSSTDGGTGPPI